MIHRRSFLLGLGAAVAAPAIVKASSLMKLPVRRVILPEIEIERYAIIRASIPTAYWRRINEGILYSQASTSLIKQVSKDGGVSWDDAPERPIPPGQPVVGDKVTVLLR